MASRPFQARRDWQGPVVRAALQLMAVLTIASLAGCGAETAGRLSSVQAAVAHAAGAARGAVSVNLTRGRYLAVAIENGAPAERSGGERAKALMLARAAYAAYDLRSTLERVTVAFPTVRKTLFVLSVRRLEDGQAFQFRSSDLIATAGIDRAMTRPPESISLYLLPIGDASSDLIAAIASQLRTRFPMPLTILPVLASYRIAYDDRRQQAVADSAIAVIERQHAALLRDPAARIIGITGDDMYTSTENWLFAFSLRGAGDRVAVVSYARMRPEAFGNASDEMLLQSRLRKMITKNLGIMCYGFPASQNARSVLYGSIEGTDELDVMTEDFDPLD
jgi:predicted Zn-dependent protease